MHGTTIIYEEYRDVVNYKSTARILGMCVAGFIYCVTLYKKALFIIGVSQHGQSSMFITL